MDDLLRIVDTLSAAHSCDYACVSLISRKEVIAHILKYKTINTCIIMALPVWIVLVWVQTL
jgi:hypothetical protein